MYSFLKSQAFPDVSFAIIHVSSLVHRIFEKYELAEKAVSRHSVKQTGDSAFILFFRKENWNKEGKHPMPVRRSTQSLKSLAKVFQQVVDVFGSDGETDGPGVNALCGTLVG